MPLEAHPQTRKKMERPRMQVSEAKISSSLAVSTVKMFKISQKVTRQPKTDV